MINVDDRLLSQCDDSEMFLLLHIAKHMSKDMTAFPKNSTLCEATKWSLNKLQRVKKRCIKKGFIDVAEQRVKGFQVQNLYKVKTKFLSVFVSLEGKGDTHTPKRGNRIPQNGVGSIPQNGVTEVLTKEVLNTMDSDESIEREMTFDEFWNRYGFKKGSKPNTVKKWEKLTGADRADIAATLDMYLRDTVTKNTGRKNGFKPLRKHPEFYLSGRIWESYLDQAKEQAEKDSVPTEYDDAYKSYLKWVQDNTPAVLHHTKHLSKQQFIAYKTTYYVKGKSVLGDYLEAKFLMDAHRAMNTNPQELESYPDAFTLHCAKVEQFVKSQPV